MSPLESAILQLQEELDSYQQGSPMQPKVTTAEWFLLRSASLGLSYLKRVQTLDVANDPGSCERLYRQLNKTFKVVEVPPPVAALESANASS